MQNMLDEFRISGSMRRKLLGYFEKTYARS